MKKRADEVFREGRRVPRDRNWIPYSPADLARGVVDLFRTRRMEPNGPEPLDEFGVPESWRNEVIDEAWLEQSRVHWEVFERWCQEHDRTAFPADAHTCLDFLRAMWDRGPELYEIWQAIDERHEVYYWHTDANAVQRMRFFLGLMVRPDGTIEVHAVDPNE
jgi:hypothetical protein